MFNYLNIGSKSLSKSGHWALSVGNNLVQFLLDDVDHLVFILFTDAEMSQNLKIPFDFGTVAQRTLQIHGLAA